MLIPLIQALYNPGVALPTKEDDYRRALQDIELFTLSPQVYQLLKDTERIKEVPSFFSERLKANHARAINHNLFMKHKEEESLRTFEQHGLQVIPLKGIRFAERYFGHFAARVTSDIDLFVPVEQLQRSIACLETVGYVFEIIKDHHARLHKDGFMIELHWTLDKQHWSDLDPLPFWDSAERLQGYQYVRELSTINTFYFICLHGARHQMDSLRYLLDVAQMIYRSGQRIDYTELMEQSAADKTSKRVQTVLSIVYQQFPHLHEVQPLPFKMIDCHWDYDTIRSARTGVKTKQYYLYKFYFKHLIFDTFKHQMKSLSRAY